MVIMSVGVSDHDSCVCRLQQELMTLMVSPHYVFVCVTAVFLARVCLIVAEVGLPLTFRCPVTCL